MKKHTFSLLTRQHMSAHSSKWISDFWYWAMGTFSWLLLHMCLCTQRWWMSNLTGLSKAHLTMTNHISDFQTLALCDLDLMIIERIKVSECTCNSELLLQQLGYSCLWEIGVINFDNASHFPHCSCCRHSCLPLTGGCFSAVQIWSYWRGQAKFTGTAKTVPEWRRERVIPNCCCQLWSGIYVSFGVSCWHQRVAVIVD